MNVFFLAACGVLLILALSHSVMGEVLLIRRISKEGLPPLAPFSLVEIPKLGLAGSPDLALSTLRFTWHLAGVLGLGIGAILLWLGLPSSPRSDLAFVQTTLAVTFFACSLVVLFCTTGKHPGWVAFAAVGILTFLA